MNTEYVGVYLLDTPYFLDHIYDYYLPAEFRGQVRRGSLVSVPFGTSNRKSLALVTELRDKPHSEGISYKPVFSLCNEKLTLSEELLDLCFFIKEQTLCTLGEAVRAIIPASVISQLREVYSPSENFTEDMLRGLDTTTLVLCDYIRKKGSVRLELLRTKFGTFCEGSIKKLRERGALTRSFEVHESEGKTENFYSLAIPKENAERILAGDGGEIKLRSHMHAELLRILMSADEPMLHDDLVMQSGASGAQIKALVDKKLIAKISRAVDRSHIEISREKPLDIELNDEQQEALKTLSELLDSGEPAASLLFGVTGSGKTCVMMKLIDHVIESGRSAIVLLPEISLTPQTLGLFCARYGERVAVIHSALSAGERYDTYTKIKEGRADVVIGTRSAVFAPLSNLGLIIIDEEQEHTYKSDMNPKYHARDIARFRCAHNGALMLLASATPSLESYKKALEGKYKLIKLKKRYGKAKLPTVTVYDMRAEAQSGNSSPLGTLLCRKIVDTKKRDAQSVLFLNRRGYNNFLSCRSCGEAIRCHVCSVSMTYHTIGRGYESGELRCHWCGRRIPVPTECPTCHSPHVVKMGYGTQRVEQEISELMPDAEILRMDTDTAQTKYAYENMLGKFRRHEADVLLGTQMVTKGHDFPNVTLVGVLLADSSLYLDDYRANERTFAMLTQVIGRAGRAERAGEAVIQTNNPDNECIRLACAQDYEAFYESEIKLRKLLVFPPFCDIALLTLTSSIEKEVLLAAELLRKTLLELSKTDYDDVPLITFGPFEAPVYKVDGKYRMRMVVKCRLGKRARALFSEILSKFSRSRSRAVNLSVDFNPSNI